jgi:hypothetical protein
MVGAGLMAPIGAVPEVAIIRQGATAPRVTILDRFFQYVTKLPGLLVENRLLACVT